MLFQCSLLGDVLNWRAYSWDVLIPPGVYKEVYHFSVGTTCFCYNLSNNKQQTDAYFLDGRKEGKWGNFTFEAGWISASTCQVESVLHFSIYPTGGGDSNRKPGPAAERMPVLRRIRHESIWPETFSHFLLGWYLFFFLGVLLPAGETAIMWSWNGLYERRSCIEKSLTWYLCFQHLLCRIFLPQQKDRHLKRTEKSFIFDSEWIPLMRQKTTRTMNLSWIWNLLTIDWPLWWHLGN